MKSSINKLIKTMSLVVILLVFYSFTFQSNEWLAPAESNKFDNPLKDDGKALAKGKKIYYQICATCHGRTGIGNGPGGTAFTIKPADHTSEKVQSQSDGALYWKITNGRGDMPSYNSLLSKTQRWQVIEFMRSLKKN
ncbi:hypothetical protein A9Q87_05010 [Flavobacteriales bacterium 34_180_T64]|nr:hypothetical protein A9Q87_05010 [Flavobacteriales bacterium 34_180_T64]